MTSMADEAFELLAEQGYRIGRTTERPDSGVSLVPLDSGDFPLHLVVKEEHRSFAVYLHLQTNIPEVHRYRVMEYITRVNYRLFLGHFEIDLDQGEVRFSHCQFMDESSVVGPSLLTVLRSILDSVSVYFPGMMRIVYGGLTALGAIAEIDREQGTDRHLAVRCASCRMQ